VILLKKIIKQLKKGEYNYVYNSLKEIKYNYSLDNLSKDFSSVGYKDMYCYLIYLISVEHNPNYYILLCDYIYYIGTFFYDIYPVIHMFMKQALKEYPYNKSIIEWIISTFENHPDSPFSIDELKFLKSKLNQEINNSI
jgi:hypothetical protein